MLKTLKHREKMSVCVNVRMSKIMHMPIKLDIHVYAKYANCWTLGSKVDSVFHPSEVDQITTRNSRGSSDKK